MQSIPPHTPLQSVPSLPISLLEPLGRDQPHRGQQRRREGHHRGVRAPEGGARRPAGAAAVLRARVPVLGLAQVLQERLCVCVDVDV